MNPVAESRRKAYQALEIRFLTLRHPWGTAALAASGLALFSITLRGGGRALGEHLKAIGHDSDNLGAAPAGDPVLSPLREWLEALLVRARYAPPPAFARTISGTSFQETVWRTIAAIPPGETRSYGEIARRIGRPRAARAVGAASAANPLPPLIPCHRLKGAGGDLRGYAGGFAMKRHLLGVERSR